MGRDRGGMEAKDREEVGHEGKEGEVKTRGK